MLKELQKQRGRSLIQLITNILKLLQVRFSLNLRVEVSYFN